MEKKYYFRGLGLGIIVTALIMGIALSRGDKREMTDAEVIARAKELGMTENTRLLEPSETDGDPEETEASAGDAAKEPVKKDVAVAQPKDDAKEKPADAEAPEEKPADGAVSGPQAEPAAQEEAVSRNTTQNNKPQAGTNEMTKQDEDTGQKAPEEEPSQEETSTQQKKAEETSVTIVSGDGSYTVAKKLEAAGVIFSASSFDDFLCQHGYDKRLRTGTFRIPAGASDEEIAGIVTNQP